MNLAKPEHPTKEYAAAIAAKQSELFAQYFNHLSGMRVMTEDEKKIWTMERDEIAAESKRVRALL